MAEEPITINIDENIKYANPAFIKMLGYESESEILKLGLFNIVSDQYLTKIKKYYKMRLEGHIVPNIHDLELKRADGSIILIECVLYCMPFKDLNLIICFYIDLHKIKSLEKKLRESEEKFRAILDSIGDFITIVDKNLKVIWTNKVVEDRFGKHLGQKCYDVYRVKKEPCKKCPVRDTFADGKTHFSEVISFERIYSVTSSPMRGRNEDIIAVVGISKEITERREAEQKLKFLSLSVEQSTEGIAVIDLEGNFLFINNAFANMHGYKSEEIIGKNLSIFHTPEQMHSVETANQQIREKGDFIGEIWHKHRDGSIFPTMMHNSIIRDDNDNPIGMIGTLRDITERKKAEEKILKERNTAQSYLDLAGVLIIALNKEGNITLINKKGCEVLGYSEEELIGKQWFKTCLPPRFCEPVFKDFKRLIGGELEPIEFYENPILTKSGEERIIAWHNTLLYDKEGNIIGTLTSGEDITERINIKEQLLQLNEELELRVKKRTRELKKAQGELIRKEKLASIGKLAGSIGHDLRNPLGIINNSVYYLNMKLKDADENIKKHLNILEGEVQRSNNIISDLLDFTRIRTFSFEKVDVNSIIKFTLDKIVFPENISLEMHLNAELPLIQLDPNHIQDAFHNIILNAIQAMSDGGKLEVKTLIQENNIEIIFKDTGIGILKKNMQKIFQPLFTTKPRGIGLGLSIVKDIIEMHDGKIEVVSEVNVGTIFTFKLPLLRKEVI